MCERVRACIGWAGTPPSVFASLSHPVALKDCHLGTPTLFLFQQVGDICLQRPRDLKRVFILSNGSWSVPDKFRSESNVLIVWGLRSQLSDGLLKSFVP